MSFFEELRRRNVLRVGLAYSAIAWLLAQISDMVLGAFDAPDWMLAALLIMLAIGLPITLILAWAFELTPGGFRRDNEIKAGESRDGKSHRKLDFAIFAVMAAAITFLLVDKFYISSAISQGQTAATQSIAVLPFTNMSDDSDHFVDGLSEELLNLLAKNPELKVAGRTSSFTFKGRNEEFRAIGEALNVEHVLEGSVRRSGDTLRVTAQLIKVDDGFHLWSETYDRPLTDIFEIQDEVASAIARQLNLRLVPRAKWPTTNVEAYAIYLEALAATHFRSEAPTEIVARLDRAIAIDPKFAKAYELQAIAYWVASGESIDSPTARRLLYESATAAVTLDPSLVVARAYAAISDPDSWSWIREFDAIEQALSSEPDNINLLATWTYDLQRTGYYSELRRAAEQLIRIEPLSRLGYDRMAVAMRTLGFRDEARRNWRKSIELDQQDYKNELNYDYMVAGEYDKAVAVFEDYLARDTPGKSELRNLVQGATDPDTGKAYLDELIARIESSNHNLVWEADVNKLYLLFGYPDEFWRAVKKYEPDGGNHWSNAEPLHMFGSMFPDSGYMSHPAFMEYAAKSTLIDLWEKRGEPDRCSKIDGDWACE